MKTATILPERLERFERERFKLRSGKGAGINGAVDACVMQVADWLSGGDGSNDHPECVAPVIAAFAIGLNDSALFSDHRNELLPFSKLAVGTKKAKKENKRAFIAADYAVRVFAPIALRAANLEAEAAKLEALPPITAANRAARAANAANAAGYAAANAANAADSAASAASAAATAGYATAGYAAAHAANYAANAADSADTKAKLRATSLECLTAMINA